MSKTKIGFSGLTVPEQIERARNIHTLMTGNVNFTTPVPALTVVNTAITALETAYNESRGRDKNKVALMRLRRREFLYVMSQEGAYVQEASGGEEEKILSSGYDVVGPKTPHSDTAGPISNLRATDGSVNGKIRVDWDKALDAVNYVVLVSLDGDFKNPEPKGVTTKTHKEIGDFESGTSVWIKIIPIGRENIGPHSETVVFKLR